MQHGHPVAADMAPDATGAARAQLTEIVTGIDAHFMKVGGLLAGAVEAIDGIVTALQDVASVFQEGDAAEAVSDLTTAAGRLFEVSGQIDRRAGEVSCIRITSTELSKYVQDVYKSLQMLQIYGMNVKIAASGTADFVEFANRMDEKLQAGVGELRGFDTTLAELEDSLARMEHNDRLLSVESRKIVPQVPDSLITDAGALRQHQHKLVALAEGTGALARSIQGNVGAILGALQVGDMARQRLEHVLTGCVLLEAYLVGPGSTSEERAEVRSHMMRLLIAQTEATSAEFRREMAALVEAMRRLQPEARRLIALHDRGDADSDQMFLRRLEGGISDAATMITQLHQADLQAEETLRIIIDTVDDLSGRAKAIRNLRVDVQQMSINIVLKCRRVEAIGRPVTVIAHEIRNYSDRLDETIDQITRVAGELNAASLRMRDQAEQQSGGASHDLNRSVEAIRESAEHTEDAMASAEAKADGILDVLGRTMEELERCLDLGHAIAASSDLLIACAGSDIAPIQHPGHPLVSLLDELARTYTMASERQVHDQFLLPGMPALAGASVAAVEEEDDDDALFDDALF